MQWGSAILSIIVPLARPAALYSVEQARALDAAAIRAGTSGYTLMKRAAEAALRMLRSRWPRALRLVVVAGGGNNGGDGYALARFAQAAGLTTTVLAAVDPQRLQGEARQAYEDLRASDGHIVAYEPALLQSADVIVDALLGVGLHAPVRAAQRAVIADLNASGRPVLSLDLPSGLDGDRGVALGDAVRADATLCFVALKRGLWLGDGPQYSGRVLFDDLGIEVPPTAQFEPALRRLTEADIARTLKPRARNANKGDFGRVLIVGSGAGMPGAVRLAGEACLRAGAGLVSTATAPQNVATIAGGRPELICLGIDTAADMDAPLAAASVVAIGPGLGRDAWAQGLLERVLGCGKPLVIDADALNLIAHAGTSTPANAVLTPHPGEAGRLLGSSAAQVQADRMAALQALTQRHAGVVVLKGAGTLVGQRDRTAALCERGNPGMAAPGMGDVLTGIIAGLLAQCRDPWSAATVGVLVHALAGDELARQGGERGLLALDVARTLGHWVNPA